MARTLHGQAVRLRCRAGRSAACRPWDGGRPGRAGSAQRQIVGEYGRCCTSPIWQGGFRRGQSQRYPLLLASQTRNTHLLPDGSSPRWPHGLHGGGVVSPVFRRRKQSVQLNVDRNLSSQRWYMQNYSSKRAGEILEYRDLTPECARLCQQLSKIDQERKEELLGAIGQDDFEERQTVWQSRLDAFDEGLLRREFFVVTPLIS